MRREGRCDGNQNRNCVIINAGPPLLIYWRVKCHVPPFRREGWSKRSLQRALCFQFGVHLHPELHFSQCNRYCKGYAFTVGVFLPRNATAPANSMMSRFRFVPHLLSDQFFDANLLRKYQSKSLRDNKEDVKCV